jgi:CHASE3 domain sensor protein
VRNVEAVGDRKRRSTVERFRSARTGGTYTAGAVLAIALLVSVAGSVVTYVEVRQAFAAHTAVDQAQSRLAALFRIQLEEDTALRGFLASGQRLYLEPYSRAEANFDADWRQLRDASARAGLESGDVILTDLRHTHNRWTAEIAQPLIRHPATADTIGRLQAGKLLGDRMQSDFGQLLSLYDSQAQDASERIQMLLLRAAISTAALILLFGFAAIVADLYRSRTQMELERERVVADTLQRAFLSGWDSVPYLRVGTAYVSSTREAAVGGDLFDIHRIDEHRSLVLVADVSGKGLDAAVETAQVKYSIRTLVEDYTDPATVLAKFNRTFISSLKDLTSFVSAFVGILDDRDWTIRYASAGHSPAYLRRPSGVEQLPVTGPVLGAAEDVTFSSLTVAIGPGDTLVLATDGLTEARDSAGVFVDDDGVIRWIRDGDHDPERLAAELISKVTRFAGGRINDDLALLIIQVEPAGASKQAAPQAENGVAAAPQAATS